MTRQVGLTKDVGWQIGVRRTFPIEYQAAWRLLTSAQGVAAWLGQASELKLVKGAVYQLPDGTQGEIRVLQHNSHLRMTWHPPGWGRASTLQVRVLPKGDRTVVAFHQEHLPGPEAREDRRDHYKAALDELERIIATVRE